MTSQIIEEHVSFDGLLRLLVVRYEDGDIAIGFDGYQWHTHPQCEAAVTGLSESEAVQFLIERIVNNEILLAVSRIGGLIRDVWPTDDPQSDLKYMPSEKSIEFRWWNSALTRLPQDARN